MLRNASVWRGSDCAAEPAAVPTGFPLLDALLPGGGWPPGALTEVLLAREGIGEMQLVLPAIVRMQSEGRDIVWLDPPYVPYTPALAAAGVDLARLYIVRCDNRRDALWAFEQALRAPECAAAFAWLSLHDERLLRRLQVAARDGRTWGVLWRRPGTQGIASSAPLRIGVAPCQSQLAVHVLKRRGGEVMRPVLIDARGQRTKSREEIGHADRDRPGSVPAIRIEAHQHFSNAPIYARSGA
jgi:cell division inhibitor SulA/protein ImuA